MIEFEILTTPDEGWDDRVMSVPEGCFFQTTLFARYYHHCYKQSPIFVLIKDSGSIIGQILMFRGLPHNLITEKKGHLRIAKKLLNKKLWILTWSNGPIIFNQEYYEVLLAFLEYISEEFDNMPLDNIIPLIYSDGIDQEKIRDVYEKSGFDSRKSATMVVPLSGDLDTLKEHLSKKTKKIIDKSQDIIVKEVENIDELRMFYNVYEETRKRNKISSYPDFEIIRFMWGDEIIKKAHKLFLTMHKGIPVSAQIITLFNRIIYQSGISISNYAIENSLYGNDILQWHVIKWGAEHGYRVNDEVGYFLHPKSQKEHNINYFKSKWGGKVIEFYQYSKNNSLLGFLKKARSRFIKTSESNVLHEQGQHVEELSLLQKIKDDEDFRYRSMILNQFSMLERELSLEENIEYNELKELMDACHASGVGPNRIIDVIKKFAETKDITASVESVIPKQDIREKVLELIENNKEIIFKDGTYAKGRLMSIMRDKLRDDFDGKLISGIIDEKISAVLQQNTDKNLKNKKPYNQEI